MSQTEASQFIVHLTTHELEPMFRSVVADALRELRPSAARSPEPDEALLSIDELCAKLQVCRDLVYRPRRRRRPPQYLVERRKFLKLSEVLEAFEGQKEVT